jgi:hypothetical protein
MVKIKQNIKLNKNSGFTLAETIIYVALIGYILTVFTALALNIYLLKDKHSSIEKMNYGSSLLLNLFFLRIKEAGEILQPQPGQASDILRLVDNGQTVRFFASNNMLFEQIDQNTPVNIFNGELTIDNLNFVGQNSGSPRDIKIFLTLKENNGNQNNLNQNIDTTICQR